MYYKFEEKFQTLKIQIYGTIDTSIIWIILILERSYCIFNI